MTWIALPRTDSNAPCAREMHSSALLPQGTGLLIAGGRTVDSVLSDVWMLSGATAAPNCSQTALPSSSTVASTSSTEEQTTSSSEVDPATLISVLTSPPTSESDKSIDVSKVQPEVQATQSTLDTGGVQRPHPLAWTRVHALELPHPRCAHSAVVSAGDFILFGGFTGQGISEDLIIARDVKEIILPSSSSSVSSDAAPSTVIPNDEKELSPSELLSQPISAHWMCLETSRAIDGRFAHSMATISLNLVKKDESADKTGIVIFGGINATQDFNDMWVLSTITKKE
mgnify:FL=1